VLVSVVMAVFNGSDVVLDAVQDIVAQTHRELELIVVDDGSTDDTVAVVSSVDDPRVRVIPLGKNGRQAAALNVGVAAARGRLIARMDADDRCGPTRIEKTVAVLAQRPAVGLCGTGGRIWDVASGVETLWIPPASDAALQRALLDTTGVLHGSVIFRRDLFERVGGYRPRFEPAEDYDLWLRLAEVCEIRNVPEPLFTYARHPGSLSAIKADLQRENLRAGVAAAVARRSGRADELGYRMPRADRGLLRKHQLSWLRRLIRRGRVRDACGILRGIAFAGR
jgi:glycosyltransferase involved in cell wall biosynthesis